MESTPTRPRHIAILGGGMAGLAVGYYARKNDIPFTIYEARDRIGGNTITLEHGAFRFDSGAHRLHDKDPGATSELKRLLGEDLARVHAPSQIYHQGSLIDFPLSPLNLLTTLGPSALIRGAIDVIRSRSRSRHRFDSFEQLAVHTYGRSIAERLLLSYSSKLWGVPCDRLSANIAGSRLRGLDVRTLLVEATLGRKARVEHLEQSTFYYPRGGIGTIPDSIARFCQEENIRKNATITRILHDSGRIEALEIDGEERIDIRGGEVVSTLPLTRFLKILDSPAPREISLLSAGLRFRSMLLVGLFLDRESVTENATVYFPDREFPFTRVYEPRNRDRSMSPEGKTSLVFEIPCQRQDRLWNTGDEDLIDLVRSPLARLGWISDGEIIDATVARFGYTYPILETGVERKIRQLDRFLASFHNLKCTGRNATFTYSWVHDMMGSGRQIIDEYLHGTRAALRSQSARATDRRAGPDHP